MSARAQLVEDRVWETLAGALRGRGKRQNTGFLDINCPMCTSRGESADRRRRCGIKYDAKGIGVNCFNCGFKTKFRVGTSLSKPMQDFLLLVGVPRDEVWKLQHWAFTVSHMMQHTEETFEPHLQASFPEVALPDGAMTLEAWAQRDHTDPDFLQAATYLFSRGDDLAQATSYYWTPHTAAQLNKRLIIPCFFEGKLVGWTARATGDNMKLKYFNQTPPNYLFNIDALSAPRRKYVIIVEGIFDALALDAVATMGARLNDQQIKWINQSDKIKIVVPDRDKAGGRLIDIAMREQWSVAFPAAGNRAWWEPKIKDAAEACARYGRLWTLRSVLATATDNNLEITNKRRQ